MTPLPARGEVWWCELPEIGRRPVVILSRDAAIPRLRRAVIAPCTTTIRGLASEVVLEPGEGIEINSPSSSSWRMPSSGSCSNCSTVRSVFDAIRFNCTSLTDGVGRRLLGSNALAASR